MKPSRGRRLDTVFVLIIFCVFAMSVLVVLSLSGSTYKNTVTITQEKYDEQTALSFMWTKVKSGDKLGKVYAGEFYGLSALCIEEEYDGITYLTMIYLYDGWIRELFFEKGIDFLPQDGTPVFSAESLALEQPEDGLIKAMVDSESLFISLRSKTESLLDS